MVNAIWSAGLIFAVWAFNIVFGRISDIGTDFRLLLGGAPPTRRRPRVGSQTVPGTARDPPSYVRPVCRQVDGEPVEKYGALSPKVV